MRIAVVALAICLAGCQSPERLRATVGNASSFQLCRAVFLAPNDVATIARGEAASRGLDCAPYASVVFQNEAEANAARNALALQLLQPRPVAPIIAPSRQTNCTSRRVGNTVQTDCY